MILPLLKYDFYHGRNLNPADYAVNKMASEVFVTISFLYFSKKNYTLCSAPYTM
ncbi:MAG TPA: hypothetical protein VIM65_18425 [Cyclobacteriaceae bacterium]